MCRVLFTVSSFRGFFSCSGSLITMATMALQPGSHVLCFITNGAMTQCLSGFSAKGVCSEKLLRGPGIMKVPLNKNIKRNLLVLRPPTQGRQSLCLFISDLFFSRSLFDSLFFFFYIHFSVRSFITVHAAALKHLHIQYTLILVLYF